LEDQFREGSADMAGTTTTPGRTGFLGWLFENWIHLVEVIGVGAAVWGLFHTAHQLSLTNDQLSQTKLQLQQAKESLRANTIFNIQRDGRELIGSIAADPKLFRFVFDLDKGASADDDIRFKAEIKVGQLINFYSSVYNQFEAGAVDEKFWKTSFGELCQLLKKTFPRSMWRQIVEQASDRYQRGFLEEGQTCLPKEN
jgi:hypothetical protein